MNRKIILYLFVCFASLMTYQDLFAGTGSAGSVYTADNLDTGNHVLVFQRNAEGALSFSDSFATNGLGTGTGLGNQGGLVLSQDERWLFVVNAGSDEITVFRVLRYGLQFKDKVSSGGQLPISITIHDKLVYVLNAGGNVGGSDNITGFHLGNDGTLTPIAGSTKPLSGASTGPAQISFNPEGSLLIVTEKATSMIDTYVVGPDGLPGDPNSQPSDGMTPFGFAFGKRNQLLVSEAFGGGMDASAVSSYTYASNGQLQTISSSVPTTETAACWVIVTNGGRFAYVTNTGSGTVSGYEISFDGHLSLLNADGMTAATGSGPIDMALSSNSRFLYTLNSGDATISAFRVDSDGSLATLNGISGLPGGANGLAAR